MTHFNHPNPEHQRSEELRLSGKLNSCFVKSAVGKVSFIASMLGWPTSEQWIGRDVEGSDRDPVCVNVLTSTGGPDENHKSLIEDMSCPTPEPAEHIAGVLASCLQVKAREEHNPFARSNTICVLVICNINFLICGSLFLVVSCHEHCNLIGSVCVCVCVLAALWGALTGPLISNI